MSKISRVTMGKNGKTCLVLMMTFFLMGMSAERQLQSQIQAEIARTQEYNSQPSPVGNRRALRIQVNRYRAQMPPFWPKTIYREPAPPGKPSYRNKRFYGGIPRG